jgi:hypothetical protein
MQTIEQHKLTPLQVSVIERAVETLLRSEAAGTMQDAELCAAADLLEVLTSRTPDAQLRVLVEWIEGVPHLFPVP